jgi:hypothetical protein
VEFEILQEPKGLKAYNVVRLDAPEGGDEQQPQFSAPRAAPTGDGYGRAGYDRGYGNDRGGGYGNRSGGGGYGERGYDRGGGGYGGRDDYRGGAPRGGSRGYGSPGRGWGGE